MESLLPPLLSIGLVAGVKHTRFMDFIFLKKYILFVVGFCLLGMFSPVVSFSVVLLDDLFPLLASLRARWRRLLLKRSKTRLNLPELGN